jgi:hypothetical protein
MRLGYSGCMFLGSHCSLHLLVLRFILLTIPCSSTDLHLIVYIEMDCGLNLYNMGLRGKVWSVLRNMYSIVKSCVRNKCVLSELFYCAVGIRQSEILLPVLF